MAPAETTSPIRLSASLAPKTALACATIAAAYLVTRIYFADYFPYFIDEGTYAAFTSEASNSVHQLFISIRDGREPFQTWLGIPFVKLGFNPLRAMRVVSIGAGLLTVLVVGLLGRRVGGARVGWAAAALCVMLPFFVVHEGIGTTEPLVTLWMATALYLQVELARRPDLRVAALLGLVLAAGLLTKDNTKPALALLPLSLLAFDWSASDRGRRLRTWLWGVAIVILAVAASQLLLRASSYYPSYQASREGGFYLVRSLGDVLDDPFGAWGTAWSAYRPAFFQYVSIPLLLAAAAGALLGWRRQPRLTLLLLAWIAFPLLISMTFAVLPFPRHVMYLVPPTIVLAAYAIVAGVDWIRRELPARAAAPVAALAVLLLLLPALLFDGRVLAHPATARYPGIDDRMVTGVAGGAIWPGVADEIRRRADGRRTVILSASANPTILNFLLGPDPRYTFVRGSSPLAPRAELAITDETPFGDLRALLQMKRDHFVVVRRFPRPRGGAAVTLHAKPG